MDVWLTASEAETRALGASLVERLLPDGVLLLEGDLGSGKTILTQGLASGLGIRPGDVQSPTFTLVREHLGDQGRLIHIDLYRLEPGQVESVGFSEILAGPGIKVVEWSERLPFEVDEAIRLEIQIGDRSNEREITVRND